MTAVTLVEIIIAALVGVGIIIWLVRRNIKDAKNSNPDLTGAINNQTADQIHQEDFKEEPPVSEK